MWAAARCALALCCAISNIVLDEFEYRVCSGWANLSEVRDYTDCRLSSDLKTKISNTNLTSRRFVAQASNKEKLGRVVCSGVQTALKHSCGYFSVRSYIEIDVVIGEKSDSSSATKSVSDNFVEYNALRLFNIIGVMNYGNVADKYIDGWRSSVILRRR